MNLPRLLGLTFLALTLTNFVSLQRSWSEEKLQTLQQSVERLETDVEPLAVSGACNCWLKSGIIYKNLGLSVYATWTSY